MVQKNWLRITTTLCSILAIVCSAVAGMIFGRSDSAAAVPSLAMVIQNTYMTPYSQTRGTSIQSVTYGGHTSTFSMASTSDTQVVGDAMTQFMHINTFLYGVPWHQKVYEANGVMYSTTGHGWMRVGNGNGKNPANWAENVDQMAKVFQPVNVHAHSNGYQFVADDTERIAKQIITLSIHLTPDQIAWLVVDGGSGLTHGYSLNAEYKASTDFAYRVIPVAVPNGLP